MKYLWGARVSLNRLRLGHSLGALVARRVIHYATITRSFYTFDTHPFTL